MATNNIVEIVVKKLNLSEIIGSYIEISKKGANYVAICPFHDDTNPSISISDSKQIFKCFVCNTGGNVITFVSEYEKIPFREALKKLANKAGVEYTVPASEQPTYNELETLLIKALNEAKNFFQYQLEISDGIVALNYLKSRGITANEIEKYNIGYATSSGLGAFLTAKGIDQATLINSSLVNQQGQDFFKNRIMFAIHNQHSDVIGFSGRSLDGSDPKYINSIESRIFKKNQIFYNYHRAIFNIQKTKEIYLCEGFMDVIALDQAKVSNAVAIMGTALTMNHIKLLKGYQVNLMFDSDSAGVNATLKAAKILLANNLKVKVVTLENAKDAAELVQSKGVAFLKQSLNHKQNIFDFIFTTLQASHNLKNIDDVKKFLTAFGSYLKYGDQVEKNHYIAKMEVTLKMNRELIESFIPTIQQSWVASVPQLAINEKKEPINYSYLLIKSLVKNPQLLNDFQFEQVHFFDIAIMNIAKYLTNKKAKIEKIIEKNYIFKEKWDIIDRKIDDEELIDRKDQLEEVIQNINMQSRKSAIKNLYAKLKKAKLNDEKKTYLDLIQKLKRKNGR